MKLLFIGDSLIEFFDWQERFPKNIVYNRGISGETVEGLYARLEIVFSQIAEADLVFVMSGINNLAMGDKTFIPIYRKIIRGLKEHYISSKIFVQSLLPVIFPWISNDVIRTVNTQLQKMAAEENVHYLALHPLFLGQGDKPEKTYLMEDGVHVSEKGYAVWSGEIEKHLRE